MRNINSLVRNSVIGSLFLLLTGVGAVLHAQERMTIQATAMGTSTQLGKMLNVVIYIEQVSTPEDRKALIDAFARSGQEGLVDVLEQMKPKGHVRFSRGGVGNDIKYIIELPEENGRRFRLVTDRNLGFGELYAGFRSADYTLAAIELIITPDGKGSGTVLPACKLMIDKKTKQIEIETFQSPWSLTNIMISND